MVYEFEIKGMPVKTGDLISTADGGGPVFPGQFWRLIGKLIPGDVDHIAIYIGPNGRCIEAGAKGVISFEANSSWDPESMEEQRSLIDKLYGIAYPLAGRQLDSDQENAIREKVAEFCIAQIGKPYNINFVDSATEDAFYCSQLAYKAYLKNCIDLDTGKGVRAIPGTESIVFPQEVWESCIHRSPAEEKRP